MTRNRYALLLMAGLVLLSACGRAKEAEQRAEAAESKLARMNTIAMEKDTLMRELLATTSFLSEINDELAKVKPAKGEKTVTYQERVIPVAEYRAAMLTRIRELSARLDDSEQRLSASQARLRALTAQDKDMAAQIVAFDSMVAEYRTIIESQRSEIVLLTAQLETVQADNVRLALEKTELTEQVTELTDEANTVYYIAGTKDELVEKGVATEAGGSRFLGIGWKSGKTLVPARDLAESIFTELDKRVAVEIGLPKPDKAYAIVSPHSGKFIEPQPDKDGRIRRKIRISDPEAFWAQSKFLIVVER